MNLGKRLVAAGIILLACFLFIHPGITIWVIIKGIELGIIWAIANLICRVAFHKKLIDFISGKEEDN